MPRRTPEMRPEKRSRKGIIPAHPPAALMALERRPIANPNEKGCVTCLRQHRKCDEEQPVCGRCAILGKGCEYTRDLRWANATQLPRQRRRTVRAAYVSGMGTPSTIGDPRSISPICSTSTMTSSGRASSLSSDVDFDLLRCISTTEGSRVNISTQEGSDTALPDELYGQQSMNGEDMDTCVPIAAADIDDYTAQRPPSSNIIPEVCEIDASGGASSGLMMTDIAKAANALQLWALGDSIYGELGSYVCKTTGDSVAYIYCMLYCSESPNMTRSVLTSCSYSLCIWHHSCLGR